MVSLTDYRPTASSASAAQIDFIGRLASLRDTSGAGRVAQAVLQQLAAGLPVPSSSASRTIDALKQCPWLPRTESPARHARPATTVRETVGEGFYALPGDEAPTVIKVQLGLSGDRTYAKQLVQNGGHWGWEYAPGLLAQLRPEMALTQEQAAKFGQLYGWCCICSSRLTNEVSIALGIGPVCREKMGW